MKKECKQKNILICGDFNHRPIKSKTMETEAEVRQFQEVVLDCFLTQHITKPTREGKN